MYCEVAISYLLTDSFSSTKIQKAQWNRLNALNKKREALETQIVASMKSMEQHSANISNELSAMFVGRKEDLLDSQPASVSHMLVALSIH
jgi:hypothetical protein